MASEPHAVGRAAREQPRGPGFDFSFAVA